MRAAPRCGRPRAGGGMGRSGGAASRQPQPSAGGTRAAGEPDAGIHSTADENASYPHFFRSVAVGARATSLRRRACTAFFRSGPAAGDLQASQAFSTCRLSSLSSFPACQPLSLPASQVFSTCRLSSFPACQPFCLPTFRPFSLSTFQPASLSAGGPHLRTAPMRGSRFREASEGPPEGIGCKKRGRPTGRPVFRPRKGIELTTLGGSSIPYRSGLG